MRQTKIPHVLTTFFISLHATTYKYMYLSHPPKSPFASCLRARFQDIFLRGVIFEPRTCFCFPARVNIRFLSFPAASPEVHRKKRVFRASEGCPQSSLSSVAHNIRRAVDYYCRQQTSTFLDKPCDNTQYPNRPPYLLLSQHTAVHTIMLLGTRSYLFVPPRSWSSSGSYFAVKIRKPAAIVIMKPTNPSRVKRMSTDARYTALLVALGDDDDFPHEDLASSEETLNAYSRSGREKTASSTCGETTQTAYT